MDKQIKRLLISEEPYHGESFIGYLVRLAELNAIPDYRWIYRLIIPKNFVNYHLTIKTNLRVDREKFARLSGITRREVNRLLYDDENTSCIGSYDLVIHDQIIRAQYINQGKPKVCPVCLAEKNYCRRIWELLPVVVCPFHKCLLIERCPQCFQQINWQRLGTSICSCKFDFRLTRLTLLEDQELRFGRYFYKKLRYSLPDSTIELEYPLNELNIEDLLKLILFAAAHLNGLPSFTARNTLADFSVSQIHEFFCGAVEVFDNWSANYHQFISEWQEIETKYKQFRYYYSYPEDIISAKYEKYESLILELNHFNSKSFEFLHYEFLNYLESYIRF